MKDKAEMILLFYVLLTFIGCSKAEPVRYASSTDLAHHPIYGTYEFGKGDNIIDYGSQPLGVVTGVISEVMMHDLLLKEVLADKSLELRFHPFLKGADLNFFLKRGDIEVAMGGDMPVISMAATYNIVVLSLGKQGFSSLVARQHMILSDLRGKRIGYPFGSNAHYALLQAITGAGLKEEDVKLVELDVHEMADALAEGRIDAFIAWEPFPTIALKRFNHFVIIHKSLSFIYLYMARRFLDQRPEMARHIIASQIRAMNWLTRDQNNLLEASRWNLEARRSFNQEEQVISAPEIARITINELLGITSAPIIPESHLRNDGPIAKEFEFLKRLGKVPSNINWEKVRDSFDRRIILEVLEEPKKYHLFDFKYEGIGGGGNE